MATYGPRTFLATHLHTVILRSGTGYGLPSLVAGIVTSTDDDSAMTFPEMANAATNEEKFNFTKRISKLGSRITWAAALKIFYTHVEEEYARCVSKTRETTKAGDKMVDPPRPRMMVGGPFSYYSWTSHLVDMGILSVEAVIVKKRGQEEFSRACGLDGDGMDVNETYDQGQEDLGPVEGEGLVFGAEGLDDGRVGLGNNTVYQVNYLGYQDSNLGFDIAYQANDSGYQGDMGGQGDAGGYEGDLLQQLQQEGVQDLMATAVLELGDGALPVDLSSVAREQGQQVEYGEDGMNGLLPGQDHEGQDEGEGEGMHRREGKLETLVRELVAAGVGEMEQVKDLVEMVRKLRVESKEMKIQKVQASKVIECQALQLREVKSATTREFLQGVIPVIRAEIQGGSKVARGQLLETVNREVGTMRDDIKNVAKSIKEDVKKVGEDVVGTVLQAMTSRGSVNDFSAPPPMSPGAGMFAPPPSPHGRASGPMPRAQGRVTPRGGGMGASGFGQGRFQGLVSPSGSAPRAPVAPGVQVRRQGNNMGMSGKGLRPNQMDFSASGLVDNQAGGGGSQPQYRAPGGPGAGQQYLQQDDEEEGSLLAAQQRADRIMKQHLGGKRARKDWE